MSIVERNRPPSKRSASSAHSAASSSGTVIARPAVELRAQLVPVERVDAIVEGWR